MASLDDRIRSAFATNQYPGDSRLSIYGADDSEEIFRLLKGKTWQEMPVEQFISGDTPIPDLTPEGFHYYMPALLIASLHESPGVSTSLTFYLTPSLLSAIAPEAAIECNKRIALFTKEQRHVIQDTLREYVARGWEDSAAVQHAIKEMDLVGPFDSDVPIDDVK